MSRWQRPDEAYVGQHRDHDTVTKKVKSRRVWARRGGRENAAFAEGFVPEIVTQSLGNGEEKCIAGHAVVMETRSQVCLMRRKTPQNSLTQASGN